MLHTTKSVIALTILLSACQTLAMSPRKPVLIHENNDFRVVTESGSFPIQRHYMDKELRGIPSHKLTKVLSAGAYLQLNKHDKQDEYSLRLHGRLPGGGPFGAWIGSTLGYGLVTFIGHGAIELVSVCTGPAYVPVSQTLHKMLAAPIHSVAVSAGIAGGIAGGVMTGPA